MITTLTPQQEIAFSTWHKEYFQHGTSTARADRQRAEAAIAKIYTAIDKPVPTFIWCDSPATSILALHFLREVSKPGSSLESLRLSLRSSLWSLESSLWSSLGALRLSLGLDIYNNLYGQHSAFWICYYRFIEKELGVSYGTWASETLELWDELAKSSCWWMPYEGVCFVSERPTRVEFRYDNQVIHSTTGPAIEFADGWKVYALHGVRFKEDDWKKVVDPNVTAETILSLKNIDQRMAALRVVGVPTTLSAMKAELLDSSPNGNKLYIVKDFFESNPKAYFLNYNCPSTGREYLSGVDPEFAAGKSADQCMAWKHNMTLPQYQAMCALEGVQS